MAESTGLLNLRTGNCTEGSNPSLSAIFSLKDLEKDAIRYRFWLSKAQIQSKLAMSDVFRSRSEITFTLAQARELVPVVKSSNAEILPAHIKHAKGWAALTRLIPLSEA